MPQTIKELNLQQYILGDQKDKELFSRDLFEGLQNIGFVILKNHSLSEELMNQAYRLSQEFFGLDSKIKKKYDLQNSGQRGYTPFGVETAKGQTVADLKEFWHIGRNLDKSHRNYEIFLKNAWPEEIKGFKTTFLKLYSCLDKISLQILEALTSPLKLDPDFFYKVTEEGNTILRILHYPPLRKNDNPRAVRAAAHEDINLITLLISASQSGLEALDRNCRWIPIDTDSKNIILDTGDMMSRLTNDVLPSTTHRVVNPDTENISRYSMPFFIHPNSDFMIECLKSCIGEGKKYEPIPAENFLQQRLVEIGLKK